MVPPEQNLDVSGAQPVALRRGVGRPTGPTLERLGLRTVAAVRQVSLEQLQAQCGSARPRVSTKKARGLATDHVEEGAIRQSLAKETRNRMLATLRPLARPGG